MGPYAASSPLGAKKRSLQAKPPLVSTIGNTLVPQAPPRVPLGQAPPTMSRTPVGLAPVNPQVQGPPTSAIDGYTGGSASQGFADRGRQLAGGAGYAMPQAAQALATNLPHYYDQREALGNLAGHAARGFGIMGKAIGQGAAAVGDVLQNRPLGGPLTPTDNEVLSPQTMTGPAPSMRAVDPYSQVPGEADRDMMGPRPISQGTNMARAIMAPSQFDAPTSQLPGIQQRLLGDVQAAPEYYAGVTQGNADAAASKEYQMADQRIAASGMQRDAQAGTQFGRRPAPANAALISGAYDSAAGNVRTGPQVGTEGLGPYVSQREQAEQDYQQRKSANRSRYTDFMDQAQADGKSYAQRWNPQTQEVEPPTYGFADPHPQTTAFHQSEAGQAIRTRRKARLEDRARKTADAGTARRLGITTEEVQYRRNLRNRALEGGQNGELTYDQAVALYGPKGAMQVLAYQDQAAGRQIQRDALGNQLIIAKDRNQTTRDVTDSTNRTRERVSQTAADTSRENTRLTTDAQKEVGLAPYSESQRQHEIGLGQQRVEGTIKAAEIGVSPQLGMNDIRREEIRAEGANAEAARKHESEMLEKGRQYDIAMSPDADPSMRMYVEGQLRGENGAQLPMPETYQTAVNSIEDPAARQAYQMELRMAGDNPAEILRIGKKYNLRPEVIGPQLRAATGNSRAGVNNPQGGIWGDVQARGPLGLIPGASQAEEFRSRIRRPFGL